MLLKYSAIIYFTFMTGLSNLFVTDALAQNEQFVPMLVYRTGPYAPNGIPYANGFRDYILMVNARDGGVGGVRITLEECETQNNTKLGVECYEKLKNKGPTGATRSAQVLATSSFQGQ